MDDRNNLKYAFDIYCQWAQKKIPEKMCVWEILDKHNSLLLELNVLELKYVHFTCT